jgi:hypothetical protein
MKAALDKGYALAIGTPGSSDANTGAYGLAENHAYQVLNYYEISTGEKLLRIRNPWRSENYALANSDNGSWSVEAKAEVGDDYVNADDGVFFIPYSIIDSGTNAIYISYVEFDWKVSFVEGTDSGTTYEFIIDNPVAQDVFLMIDVLSERTTDCTSGNRIEIKWLRPDWSDYDWIE